MSKETSKLEERQFVHLQEAWYGEAAIGARNDFLFDEITITIKYINEDNEPVYRGMTFLYYANTEYYPAFRVFSDAFSSLPFVEDLFKILSKNDEELPPLVLKKILVDIGFIDNTPYQKS